MGIVKHLIVEEFGTHVGKHSERLQVERIKTGEKLVEAPLMHLETVLIATRGASLSADAIAACSGNGIPIHFVSSRGEPYAALYSAGLTGTVETRRAQLTAWHDPSGGRVGQGHRHRQDPQPGHSCSSTWPSIVRRKTRRCTTRSGCWRPRWATTRKRSAGSTAIPWTNCVFNCCRPRAGPRRNIGTRLASCC